MLFSVIFSTIIIFMTLVIDEVIAEFMLEMEGTYGENFIYNQSLFINSNTKDLNQFCPGSVDKLLLFA